MSKGKIIGALSLGLSVAFLGVTAVFASPANEHKAENNPQVVAYYTTGEHGIVGEPETHTGVDLVKLNGNSGNLQQWFTGFSTEEGGITEGDHSVWRNVGSNTSCPSGWDFVADAYPEWGDYLEPGANYCVHTNDFNSH